MYQLMLYISLIAISLSPAFAAPDSSHQHEPLVLEELLVTETQDGNPRDHMYAGEIKENDPHDAGEIFKYIPGFGIARRGYFASEPVLRGFRYDQLNIVYDGVMKIDNACPNRMDPITTHVAPDEVERVEIIKGPYNVRFGPSVGGSINLITKRPDRTQEGIKGEFSSGYNNNGQGKYSRLSSEMTSGMYDVSLTGGIRDFDTYKSGSGAEVPSAFRTWDYAVKLGLEQENTRRLQLSLRQSFARDVMHAGLPMDLDKDNSTMILADFKEKGLAGGRGDLTAKIYGSYVDHVMSNTGRPNFSAVNAVATLTAREAGGRAEFTIPVNHDVLFYAGMDSRFMAKNGERRREVKKNMSTGALLPQPRIFNDLVWQDSWRRQLGVFSEASGKLKSIFRWSAGIRFDYASSGIEDPAQDFSALYGDNLQPDNMTGLGLTSSAALKVASNLNLHLAAGRGVRFPNLLELYINHFNVGMDAYEYVGNPGLVPEINNQADLSAVFRNGPVEIFGSGFYSYIQDYISARVDNNLSRKYNPAQPPTSAKRFTNIPEAELRGFELGSSLGFLNSIRLMGDVSYTWARNLTEDEPLPEIPPLTGHAGVRYQKKRYWLEVRGTFAAAQERISDSFGETSSPNYQVWDLRLMVRPLPYLECSLGIHNALDAAYYNHLSRSYLNSTEAGTEFYEPGRSFRMGIRLLF